MKHEPLFCLICPCDIGKNLADLKIKPKESSVPASYFQIHAENDYLGTKYYFVPAGYCF